MLATRGRRERRNNYNCIESVISQAAELGWEVSKRSGSQLQFHSIIFPTPLK